MKAIAVIGMNYGDEGKGHITNYFASPKALNIRFNGGAQALHSVFLPDGRNHYFRHFGAGSLKGARTLLTHHFIVNPILFAQELSELSKKVKMREVFIDPRCLVTTHFDMLLNAFISHSKGSNDTCGIGINETIERSQFKQLRINVRNLVDNTVDQLSKVLATIENEYIPSRVKELKLPLSDFMMYCQKRIIDKKKITENYFETIKLMLSRSVIWPDDNLIDRFLEKELDRYLIFEGAQGLLLDQNRIQYMPFLTRSNTGLKNVLSILRTVRSPIEMEAYLVTRAYLTRHGDGPIFNQFTLPYQNVGDIVNVDNEFQGKLRFGFLNMDWYKAAIKETSELHKNPSCLKNFAVSVAMTCLDQVGKIKFSNGSNDLQEANFMEFEKIKLISKGATESFIKN